MIDELHVQDVALIHDAVLEPAAGLTALTGETGAGKSALLSAVKLLVGDRADAGAVREGADGLVVEGRLFGVGEDPDPDGTIVRRRVEAGGRGRVEIDGRMASVRELASTVGATIDLCGQHEHQRLLAQASHVELLDAWIGEKAQVAKAAYRDALAAAQEAADELARVQEASSDAAGRLDAAEFVLRRIDEVEPREGELEELEAALPKVEHAEALMEAAARAHASLSGDDAAVDLVSQAVGELRDASRYDTDLDKLVSALSSALIDLEDVASELRDYRDSVDYDPEALNQMQSRMAQLQGLMRTYGPGMDQVFARREEAAQLVAAATDGGESLRRAQKAVDAAEKKLAQVAEDLDGVRREAAPRLAQAINEQMAFLEMGTAEIEVAFEPLARGSWTREGASRVELMYRPAAGLSARPLRRIASGGEVSRVMLACKVVLGEADKIETLVFDEVDAGVGGATALALAQVLAKLAKTHQVIVVTHLAQVAVQADRHYLVAKSGGDLPETSLTPIAGDDRVREIARMLSGDESQASLDHALQMLDGAHQAN